jgi:cell division transport system ATP-binding protein
MIQLYNVSKSYEKGVVALSNVTLEVKKGEFLFVTGTSGAGKSTLLKIMLGVEPPTSGNIIIEGRNCSRLRGGELACMRRKMGFVFQDFKLLPKRTVFENVALALKISGVESTEIKERVMKAVSYVKLGHRANFRPSVLSGGEQQRVSIARALVKEPDILLADEPTGNLDPELSLEIMGLFSEIHARGTTVVVATHDASLIERFSKRVVTLKSGKIV